VANTFADLVVGGWYRLTSDQWDPGWGGPCQVLGLSTHPSFARVAVYGANGSSWKLDLPVCRLRPMQAEEAAQVALSLGVAL
jgi:hypothetical protein